MGKPETLLVKAAFAGDLNGLEEALAAGADLTLPAKSNDNPPIVKAAQKGQAVAVEWFLSKGVNLLQPSPYWPRHTVLQEICRAEKLPVYDVVLRVLTDKLGAQAAKEAIFGAALEMEWRIGAHASKWLCLNAWPGDGWRTAEGETALQRARARQLTELVAVLESPPKPPKAGAKKSAKPDAAAVRAFLAAAKAGDVGGLRASLESGVPIDASVGGTSALIEAASNGKTEAVAYLLGCGADHLRRTSGGWSALERALDGGHWDGALALLGAGVKFVNVPDTNGRLTMHIAATGGAPEEVIAALVDHGFNPNEPQFWMWGQDEDGNRRRLEWYPIHYAAEEGHLATIQGLVKRGADIHQRGHNGVTPLMRLVFGHCPDIITRAGGGVLPSKSWRKRHFETARWFLEQTPEPLLQEMQSRMKDLYGQLVSPYAWRLADRFVSPDFDFRTLIEWKKGR